VLFRSIAIQCSKEQHIHVLSFFVHIEIVDENNQPCKHGEVGRVLVTSLHNFAQPMIRYELGDLASFGPDCEHIPGLPVINPEVTRVRDSYITKDGRELFPRFGKARFLTYRGMRDYQVVLFEDAILVMYSSAQELSRLQEREMQEDVAVQFGNDFPVTPRRVESSELLSHWKRRVFYKVPQPAGQLESLTTADLEALLKPS